MKPCGAPLGHAAIAGISPCRRQAWPVSRAQSCPPEPWGRPACWSKRVLRTASGPPSKLDPCREPDRSRAALLGAVFQTEAAL